MSKLNETAARAVVMKYLADRIEEGRKAATVDVLDALDVGDRKRATLPDGDVIGTVSVSARAAGAVVTDENAFTQWVADHASTEVVTSVRPAYKKLVLGRLKDTDDGVIDTATGEIVPGVEFGDPGRPYASVRISDEQADALEAAIADGRINVLHGITRELEQGQNGDDNG